MDLWETQMTKVDSWCEHQRQWESRTGWGRTGCCWGWCCTRGASTRWTCSSSGPCLSGSSSSSPARVEAGFQVCTAITTPTIIIAKHLNRKLKNELNIGLSLDSGQINLHTLLEVVVERSDDQLTRGLYWRKLRTNCFALGDFYLTERFSQASKVDLCPHHVWFDQHWYCQSNPDIFPYKTKDLPTLICSTWKKFSFVKTFMGISLVKGFWIGLLPEVTKYWMLFGKCCVRRNKVI